jgi:hypothetical protein
MAVMTLAIVPGSSYIATIPVLVAFMDKYRGLCSIMTSSTSADNTSSVIYLIDQSTWLPPRPTFGRLEFTQSLYFI